MSGRNELICRNVRTLKKNGSLLYCALCGQIIGYLNPRGYTSLYLTLACRCGTGISLKYNYDRTRSGERRGNRPLVSGNGLFCCERCGKPLLSLKISALKYFTGSIKCRCGKEYTCLQFISAEERI